MGLNTHTAFLSTMTVASGSGVKTVLYEFTTISLSLGYLSSFIGSSENMDFKSELTLIQKCFLRKINLFNHY